MKIYTKSGDKGYTSLLGGKRVKKTDPRVEACGTLDEMNAAIGLACAHTADRDILPILYRVQNEIFLIGAQLAAPNAKTSARNHKLPESAVKAIELDIDRIQELLPELHAFILPGGHPAGAALHLARAVTRRAERRVLPLVHKDPKGTILMTYLNRLSDLLFVLARAVNHGAEQPERLWSPGPKKASCRDS